MLQLRSRKFRHLRRSLKRHRFESTAGRLAGLLTVPSLQANTCRLEVLVHLAVAHCDGVLDPVPERISHWLNSDIGSRLVVNLEDPAEDVFITNVGTPFGNFRLFEGNCDSNDYFVQTILVLLGGRSAQREWRELLGPIMGMLKVSECVADELSLQRWTSEDSAPGHDVVINEDVALLEKRRRAVTFSEERLVSAGIRKEDLSQFIFERGDGKKLLTEQIGHTSLERRPLIKVGDNVIVTLPHCIGRAITRFVIDEIGESRCSDKLLRTLTDLQTSQVERDVCREFKRKLSLPKIKSDSLNLPMHREWLLAYDVGKPLHVILLQDPLDRFDVCGLWGFVDLQADALEAVNRRVQHVRDYCGSNPGFEEGTTLLVLGGLGRGFKLALNRAHVKWHITVVRISDLIMIAQEPGRSVTRYLKCTKRKAALRNLGLKFVNVGGDFGLYCAWKKDDYRFVPRKIPLGPGTVAYIGTKYNLWLRKRIRRLLDHHVVETRGERYLPVLRLHCDSYFPYLRESRIYGSLTHASKNIIAGVVETAQGTNWFTVEDSGAESASDGFAYGFWFGFIDVFAKLVSVVESRHKDTWYAPLEICVDFTKVQSIVDVDPIGRVMDFGVHVDIACRIATISLPADFLKMFRQPENTGEKRVLRSLASCLIQLQGCSHGIVDVRILDEVVGEVIGNESMRILHAFKSHDILEHIQNEQRRDPVFLAEEDYQFLRLGLVEDGEWIEQENIEGRNLCNAFLHKIVARLFVRQLEHLRKLDRSSVICEMLRVHEDVLRDRFKWGRTARALEALHSTQANVVEISRQREAKRSLTGLAVRAMLEIAVCECPEVRGRELGRWQLDELVAVTALLLETAMASDAIHSGFIEPRLELYANGDFSIDQSVQHEVVAPFLAALHREQFGEAVEGYSDFYSDSDVERRVSVEERYSFELRNAFKAEYGISLREAFEGCNELVAVAVERSMLVCEIGLGDLRARLIERCGFSKEVCNSFVETFGLFHRTQWEQLPKGFSKRDLYPWRFSRRLSVIARPLLILGADEDSTVIFGAGTLRLGLAYLVDMIERGHLAQEFFVSKSMKSFLGRTNDEKGHEFAVSVSEKLRMEGWKTRVEVKMSELGGDKELGDIDVLAWNGNQEVLVIECKRLQLARTIGEIADVCRRFRGEAMDELAKHVRRIEWIRVNAVRLKKILNFKPVSSEIDDRLITNVQVPMSYLKSLPIPPEKIGPLE